VSGDDRIQNSGVSDQRYGAATPEVDRRLRVLVCVEPSQSSLGAAVEAHRVFGASAEYTVVSVGKGDAAPMPGDEEVPTMVPFDMTAAQERGRAAETAALVAGEVLGPGARAVGLVGSRPAQLVCEVAGRMEADYVVIGSVRRGLLRRTFSKSFGLYVVRNAPCAVLVGPPPE